MLESVLSDQALTVSGKTTASTEKNIENKQIEQAFADLLVQLEALTGFSPENLSDPESGKWLPFNVLEGNTLPPLPLLDGQLQDLVLQSRNDPTMLMQALALLKHHLNDPSASLSLEKTDLQRTPVFLSGDRLSTPLINNTGKEENSIKLTNLLSDFEPEQFRDFNSDRKFSMDLNRLNQVFTTSDENVHGTRQQITAPVRDSGLPANGLSSIMPTNTLVRADHTSPVLTVQTQLFKPDWSESFNSNILVLVKDQVQSARLNLNPPELGPIEIRLSIQKDHTNIHFYSQHGVVRDVIEDAFPRLRELMSSSGINLGDVNVSQHSASGQPHESSDLNRIEYHDTEMEDAKVVVPVQIRSHNLIDQYI